MSNLQSSYYPPRARWYSPLFHLGDSVRRRLNIEALHPPAGIGWLVFCVSMVLPGLSFAAAGRKMLGQVVMGVYFVAVLIFLIWLGYPVANVIFGLMISVHVSSIIFGLNHWLSDMSLVRRLLYSLAILLVVSQLIYVPTLNLMERHLAMPLRVRERVLVVNTMIHNTSVKRGDLVAYHFTGGNSHGVRIRDGYGLDPVLGTPGDVIRFSPKNYEINGQSHPRLVHMPAQGELVVPEQQWFIWPSLDTVTQRGFPEDTIADAVVKSALVPKDQFVGKPFRHWFGRRQIMP